MYLKEGPGLLLLPLLLLPFLLEVLMLLSKSHHYEPLAKELRELKSKIKSLTKAIKPLSDIDDFVAKKKLERELLSSEKEFEEKKKNLAYLLAVYEGKWKNIKFIYNVVQFGALLVLKPLLIEFEGFALFPLGYWLSFPKFRPGPLGTMVLTSSARNAASLLFPVNLKY